MTPWTRRRIRRRLAELAGSDERVVHVERLVVGGWWVTTDQSLYHLADRGDARRVPFSEIRSVQRLSVDSKAIVVTAAGERPLIGDLPAKSVLARQLLELRSTEGS